jgi:hypothetical protein
MNIALAMLVSDAIESHSFSHFAHLAAALELHTM